MIKQYFYLNYKKWLYTLVMLFFLCIGLKYLSPETFLPTGAKLNLWDYVFSSLSYPLAILLVIPISYCYLIGDIFTRDFEGGYIEFFLSRISNRVTYFISKATIIFITSNLFFVCYLTNLFIVSLIYKLPFSGKCYYEVVTCSIKEGNHIIATLAIQYELFIITLCTLGLFILIISMIFNNSVYGFIGVIILVLQGHDAVFNNNSRVFFSPIAQGILALHSPFCFYVISGKSDLVLRKFTINYSLKYLKLMLLLFLAIGCFRIRNMNISRKG
jgi:hypothetical protein